MNETTTEARELNATVLAQPIARIETQPLTTRQLVEQVQLIQQVMKAVMKPKVHFDVIPGCGDKPTLLKPGAEKLSLTFQMRPEFTEIVQDIASDGHREYRVTCKLFSIASGFPRGEGIGSCTTMESKYRYRTEMIGDVPPAYWDSRDQSVIGGLDFFVKKAKGKWVVFKRIPHDNPSDYWNTCLKMAKKRAFVDAILTATAASDCFVQDVEDLADNGVVDTGEQPEAASHEPTPPPAPVVTTVSRNAPSPGNWRSYTVPFGKNKGITLGALEVKSRNWYITDYEPREYPEGSGKFNPADIAFRKVLDQAKRELWPDKASAAVAAQDAVPMDFPEPANEDSETPF